MDNYKNTEGRMLEHIYMKLKNKQNKPKSTG